uniref:Uncharacterized protein n=1 Tax=Cannabis sativa TaxID=3483 RepID=A0A803QI19_CANSA
MPKAKAYQKADLESIPQPKVILKINPKHGSYMWMGLNLINYPQRIALATLGNFLSQLLIIGVSLLPSTGASLVKIDRLPDLIILPVVRVQPLPFPPSGRAARAPRPNSLNLLDLECPLTVLLHREANLVLSLGSGKSHLRIGSI